MAYRLTVNYPAVRIVFDEDEILDFPSVDDAYDWLDRAVLLNNGRRRDLFADKRDIDRTIAAIEADTVALRDVARELTTHL